MPASSIPFSSVHIPLSVGNQVNANHPRFTHVTEYELKTVPELTAERCKERMEIEEHMRARMQETINRPAFRISEHHDDTDGNDDNDWDDNDWNDDGNDSDTNDALTIHETEYAAELRRDHST
jgi:hypothetical protein